MLKSILSVLISLSLCVLAGAWGTEGIAIQAGRILTISDGEIEHGVILIGDGKIKGIG